MKYKVGEEVLLKATISDVKECTFPDMPYTVMVKRETECKGVGVEHITICDIGEDAIVDMTNEEAWRIAGKIAEMDDIDIKEFILDGDAMHPHEAVFYNLTPQAAKAKIEAWEAKKDIRRGDEVHVIAERCRKKDIYYFVTRNPQITNNGYAEGIDKNGDWHSWRMAEVAKTGRNIDIQGLLGQIGGTEC